MKSFHTQARQGDVFIERVDSLPEDLVPVEREGGRVVLAHGEVTGHMHAIIEKHVVQFRARDVERDVSGDFRLRAGGGLSLTFMKVEDEPCVLTHDEHESIEIKPGLYRVRRQREYVRGQVKNVAD